MKFGHFSDTAREYVITTPRTPLPWINYLGSEAFFSLCFSHGRWVQLLQGCQAAAYHSLPLQ